MRFESRKAEAMRNLFSFVFIAGFSLLASAAPSDPFANRALNPVTPEQAPAGGALTLVRDGKPAFVILSDRSVEAKMDTRQLRDCRCITPAVETLKRYLEEATGATVDEDDVANAAKYPDRLQVLVGESALTRELGLRAAEMPREGFTVTTFAKGVAIVGHDSTLIPGFFREPLRLWKQGDRFGTLWGVYDFLERFLGCRFYYPGPDGRIVPPCRDLAIAPVRYSDRPYIANRGGFYMRYWPEPKRSRTLGFKATDAELADFRRSIRWTEGVVKAGTAHSPRPEAWIKANPELVDEFFFRDPSGHLWASTNSHAANFFDVTNLKNVENYVKTLKKFYASGGKDEQGFIAANGYYIPVGQCDTDVSLTTMAANETVKKLGLITEENLKLGRPGQFADIYGRFHYYLSKRLKEEFPDKQMTLIGYNSYTWPPTQAKYRPLAAPAYVALAFRKMPKFYRHDATREECVKLLKAWREWNCGVPVEMLWNYNTGNTCFVHAIANNFIGEMIRGFGGDLGTSCVFPEFQMVGNVLENKYVTQLFYFYCYYTGMRQLWNPDYDYHAGYDELWDLMFGEEAGAHLKALYAVLEDSFTRYALPTANEKALYPKDVLARIGTELDAAEAAIRGNAVRERRFRFVQLPLRHELAIQRFRHDFRPPESAVRRDAPTVVPFMDPNGTGKPIEFSPKLAFTWTDEGLKGTLETDFEPVVGKDMWQGDVVELFFSPGEEKAWKCQLCVDAKGRMTQRQQTMKPIPGAVDCEWRMPGFTHAETRTAKGWKLEFLVPFKSLNDAAAPKPGERMSFACVYNKSLGKGGGHAMVATSVLLMDNHNADNWGWLRFAD